MHKTNDTKKQETKIILHLCLTTLNGTQQLVKGNMNFLKCIAIFYCYRH